MVHTQRLLKKIKPYDIAKYYHIGAYTEKSLLEELFLAPNSISKFH